MSTTTNISTKGVIDLVNANAFAEAQGTPLTMFVVITWPKTKGWTEVTHSARQSAFFKNLASWTKYHGAPLAYYWTLEKSNRIGLHMNLAIHAPKPLFGKLVQALPKMIPGFIPDTHTLCVIGDTDGPPKYCSHGNQRLGILKYFLKGMDHTATFSGPNAEKLNFADHIGIQHRGQQGAISGKRFGVGHSLGDKARRDAGYEDRTSPDGLKALLAPV